MFNRALALTRKLGFPDVILPGKEAKSSISNGDRGVQGGGGDKRPDGLEERKEGMVKVQRIEDVDEGAEGHCKKDVRLARNRRKQQGIALERGKSEQSGLGL